MLNEVAKAALTELLRDQSIFAVQNCLGKLVFLSLVHTIIEERFCTACSANQSLNSSH